MNCTYQYAALWCLYVVSLGPNSGSCIVVIFVQHREQRGYILTNEWFTGFLFLNHFVIKYNNKCSLSCGAAIISGGPTCAAQKEAIRRRLQQPQQPVSRSQDFLFSLFLCFAKAYAPISRCTRILWDQSRIINPNPPSFSLVSLLHHWAAGQKPRRRYPPRLRAT